MSADTKSKTSSITRLDGIREVVDKYDVFILDQFGVIHNGAVPYPGAIECFDQLHAAGKKIIILSNTARRAATAIKSLSELGFDSSKLTGFICSGEEAWHYVRANHNGGRLTWFTWSADDGYLDGLDLTFADAEHADFLLCQGTDVIRAAAADPISTDFRASGDAAAYAQTLRCAAARGLEMIVANPDLQATQPDGSVGYMPGAIARAYESEGGRTTWFGKPHRRAFEACVALLGPGADRARVVHVGDSAEVRPCSQCRAASSVLVLLSSIYVPTHHLSISLSFSLFHSLSLSLSLSLSDCLPSLSVRTHAGRSRLVQIETMLL
jgi:HAD superfamily hydrolase (TIGR01459 family)